MSDIEEESDDMLEELRRHNIYASSCKSCGILFETDVYNQDEARCEDCEEVADD